MLSGTPRVLVGAERFLPSGPPTRIHRRQKPSASQSQGYQASLERAQEEHTNHPACPDEPRDNPVLPTTGILDERDRAPVHLLPEFESFWTETAAIDCPTMRYPFVSVRRIQLNLSRLRC